MAEFTPEAPEPTDQNPDASITVSSVTKTELRTTRKHFLYWLDKALSEIEMVTMEMTPTPNSKFSEQKPRSGKLGRRFNLRDIEILSDQQEVATIKLFALASDRLEVTLQPSLRPHKRLAYALLLQQISWTYKEAGDLTARALPSDWMARLWPEQHRLVEWATKAPLQPPEQLSDVQDSQKNNDVENRQWHDYYRSIPDCTFYLKTTFEIFANWMWQQTRMLPYKKFITDDDAFITLQSSRIWLDGAGLRLGIGLEGTYIYKYQDHQRAEMLGNLVTFRITPLSQDRIEVKAACSQGLMLDEYYAGLLWEIAKAWASDAQSVIEKHLRTHFAHVIPEEMSMADAPEADDILKRRLNDEDYLLLTQSIGLRANISNDVIEYGKKASLVISHETPLALKSGGVAERSPVTASSERGLRLPPIEDPTDKRIYDIVSKDLSLTDGEVGVQIGMSRQNVNIRRRKLEDMGYTVRRTSE